jgi:hypothetical protein
MLLWLCISDHVHARALKQGPGRLLFLTLIPNFESQRIQFDGQSELNSSADALDISGLPLKVEKKWKDPHNPTWNIVGTIQGGRVEYDPEQELYHLLLGPIILNPYDELNFIFPFINLDTSQIQPIPDILNQGDQRTYRFTYIGGEKGRQIRTVDIPFTPITKKIDLILTPLVGETMIKGVNSFRLSGRVEFHSISEYDEFSRHCQSSTNRLEHGDYRVADLLYSLDFPHFFGPDVLNPIYRMKPTRIALRSELTSCQYDQEKKIGQVDAIFTGRTYASNLGPSSFPEELSDFVDGNYPFSPPNDFRGVRGYEIKFGKIVLAPGDTLTINIPHTHIQVDSLTPVPDNLIYLDGEQADKQTQIVYTGPAAFALSLPYVPQSGLYLAQFPALIRPAVSGFDAQFRDLYPFDGSWMTWSVLSIGLLLVVLSRAVTKLNWFAIPGWLLLAFSLFYGMKGSFGLLCLAIILYISQVTFYQSVLKRSEDAIRKIIMGLMSLILIVFAVYLDDRATQSFRGLREINLSPLTPLVLILLIAVMFMLLYGRPKDAKIFTYADLPTLVLFLAVLALYDAFNKSLLSLLILFAWGIYVVQRASPDYQRSRSPANKNTFGTTLQTRLKLAFGNKIIPTAILILFLFAAINDISNIYGTELQISTFPQWAPIVIPLLAAVSVSLTFSSIAILFVLVYPFLPSRAGYVKAIILSLFLFLVFLFGIGTDDRLIGVLPSILVGRVIYYLSVPMLIGLYFDIHEVVQKENKRLASAGGEKKRVTLQSASSLYFKNLQGIAGTLAGIFSIVAPTVYAFIFSEPVFVTYFDLIRLLLSTT